MKIWDVTQLADTLKYAYQDEKKIYPVIISANLTEHEENVGEHSSFKKIPTITQDLSRRSIATSEERVSTYPRRPKAEAFS